MSGPIFGNSSALGGSSGGNRHLVEFRAGRMNMVGKMVHPDTRKGLVYMYQAEDGLIHFCWKDRTTGNVEDDLIIFPDDCEFKKIEQCKTGRVFLLKFKSSSRKLFFWLQEPKTDKDEEWGRRVNEVMNNPPSMSNSGSSRSSGGTDGGDLQYMLNNMSQQQLMQLFGGVGQMGGLSSLLGSMNRPSSGGGTNASSRLSSTTTPSRTTSSSTGNTTTTVTTTPSTFTTPPSVQPVTPQAPQVPKRPTRASNRDSTTPVAAAAGGTSPATTDNSRILLSGLQNYLSGLNSPAGAGGGSSSSRRNVDLSTAINSDAVGSILSDPNFVTALQNHLPNIDSGNNSKDQLKDTLTSPQFQQALSMFSSALQSGQLGPVVSQFQMSPEVVEAANSGDIEQFVKALEKTNAAKKESDDSTESKSDDEKQKKEEGKKDDDENMQLE